MSKREFSRDEYIVNCTHCNGDGKVPATIEARAAGLYMSKETKAHCPVCNGNRVVDLLPKINEQKRSLVVSRIISITNTIFIGIMIGIASFLLHDILALIMISSVLIILGYMVWAIKPATQIEDMYTIMEMAKSKRNDDALMANHELDDLSSDEEELSSRHMQ